MIRRSYIRNQARKESYLRERLESRFMVKIGNITYIKPDPLTAEERKFFEDQWLKLN